MVSCVVSEENNVFLALNFIHQQSGSKAIDIKEREKDRKLVITMVNGSKAKDGEKRKKERKRDRKLVITMAS